MTPFSALAGGTYRPGNSPVHRLDARYKVIVAPLLVVAAFAATGCGQLGLLSLLLLAAWRLALLPLAMVPRLAWRLRWLLLFTVLVHLFFTPGRTLFGQTWLSLDGLQTGLLTCWRLLLSLLAAAGLGATTAPAALAGALGWLLSPLRRLGLPVAGAAGMVLLVLHFIPLLRSEALAAHEALAATEGRMPSSGYLRRGRYACRLVTPLLLRLVSRGDELARRLAGGEMVAELQPLAPPAPLRPSGVALLATVLAVAMFIYGRLA